MPLIYPMGFMAGSVSATIGTPQLIASSITSAANTTNSATSSVAIQAGDTVVVLMGPFNDGTCAVTSVTDGTNTYALGHKLKSGAYGFEVWYAKNCSAVGSGATITTNTSAGANNRKFAAVRFAGGNATAPLDVTVSNSTASATPTVATGALASASEVIFGCIGTDTTVATITEDASFTNLINSSLGSLPFCCGYKVVTSASTLNYAPTLSSVPGNMAIGVCSFKP